MTNELYQSVGEIKSGLEILLKAEVRNEEKRRRLYERIEVVERQNEKLLDQQEVIRSRLQKAEVMVDEYKRIKQMGRGWMLGAAMFGGGVTLAVSDWVTAAIKAIGR
ncbi:hypothetical protein [Martelella soudanensis]|uniref:hypothetical protein n=1 Tax=unclassified Martelella TaxID=2629616 RepID=UPI0015E046A9|nr:MULTISPECIES: hypothetical protein [unclassified Martelella]